MARDLLSDSDSESSEDQVGGAGIDEDLKVNEEYAKRFEHNKKREELQRLEEKHGSPSRKRKRGNEDGETIASASESFSSSEDEDEEAEFATEALDSEILATLNAIKSKDPRVYDSSAVFYSKYDENAAPAKEKEDKPMFLRDYHRENLLNGVKPEAEEQPLSYNQQQEQLKKSILSEMNAAAASDDTDSDSDGGLLVKKQQSRLVPTKASDELDVESADRDPEMFLSNFMASRAWLPTDNTELHPFESDDEEEEKRAEEFEEAYNMRFEDPEKSNEKLRSHARDVAARYSVRREETNPRKKKRESEKQAKEVAKQELREEKARLRKLRMDEVAGKVERIKQAAGLKASDLKPEDWAQFIDGDWDDAQWEAEMHKRFGDEYYAEDEDIPEEQVIDGADTNLKIKKRKVKKPKFEDDIDIKDIIPDFESEDDADQFDLTDNDEEEHEQEDENDEFPRQPTTKKSLKQQKREKQKDSRTQRRVIEQLVDDQLQLELQHALPASSLSKSSGFRYRETSPQSFGLTARDILLAEDSALNEFAGLKKLAAWRPEDKKRKDQKRLGKKARLRKWRAETFGNEEGPMVLLDQSAAVNDEEAAGQEGEERELGGVNVREKGGGGEDQTKKKRRKGRRGKKPKIEA